VAIYSLKEVRDDSLSPAPGKALMTGELLQASRLRRDVHEPFASCFVHHTTTRLSLQAPTGHTPPMGYSGANCSSALSISPRITSLDVF
jgi:hypothetical protein